jgi:hypothetical protein
MEYTTLTNEQIQVLNETLSTIGSLIIQENS